MLKHIRFYRPQDEYGFMSNYFEYRFWLDGRDWLSVEHYYQAQKFAGSRIEDHIRRLKRPGGAKAYSHKLVSLWRADWTAVKCDVMRKALMTKFSTSGFLSRELLLTGDAVLIEDSPTDLFWGAGQNNEGMNMLGRLLMETRETIRWEIEEEADEGSSARTDAGSPGDRGNCFA